MRDDAAELLADWPPEPTLQALREAVEAEALCSLPGFLTPSGREALLREAVELRSRLAPRTAAEPRSAYSWMDNSGFDETHPRGR